jgi:hypothetical protein
VGAAHGVALRGGIGRLRGVVSALRELGKEIVDLFEAAQGWKRRHDILRAALDEIEADIKRNDEIYCPYSSPADGCVYRIAAIIKQAKEKLK